uniref:Translin-associated protein X n=1 Tax=Cacopsylla melanoneura TaxID=428564 RepID=A0A8D8M5I8_9HEMI
MSNRGGGFRDRKRRDQGGSNMSGGEKKKLLIDENNPVVQEFRKYAVIMNAKQDKYERLVKISRDITIESKRVIFLLHSLLRSDTQKVLEEAETRLNALMQTQFKAIKAELKGEDLYQYLRAFSAGLQEFIEAYTFLYYLKSKDLIGWEQVENKLEELCGPEAEESQVKLLTPTEFVLGVGDLSGELMRYAIGSVAAGTDTDDCVYATNTVRDLYVAMLESGAIRIREVARKFAILRQSLMKMERTVYTVKVRGSEMPRHVIAHVVNECEQGDNDIDEGFF